MQVRGPTPCNFAAQLTCRRAGRSIRRWGFAGASPSGGRNTRGSADDDTGTAPPLRRQLVGECPRGGVEVPSNTDN
jgi:hypothetical protein